MLGINRIFYPAKFALDSKKSDIYLHACLRDIGF
jgi:hypothetical protein